MLVKGSETREVEVEIELKEVYPLLEAEILQKLGISRSRAIVYKEQIGYVACDVWDNSPSVWVCLSENPEKVKLFQAFLDVMEVLKCD